jgi:ABC-2 type transport system ATP-binding protein
MSSMVRLAGTARSFGAVDAVLPLDLTITRGRCLGVIGHNGSGKSTLLQLIAGRLRPTAGAVEVAGTDVHTREGQLRVRRDVAVGGTVAAFYPDLTVGEHLELVAIAHAVDDVATAVDGLLERYGLAPRRDALPVQLSTGMRQKLDLGMAFIRPSLLLLLDEPDRGLDPAARRRLWEDVAAYRASGRTVLLATHHPDGLDDLLDEVVLLEHGRVAADGTLDEVRGSDAGARLGLAS